MHGVLLSTIYFIWCAHTIRDHGNFRNHMNQAERIIWWKVKAFPGNILQCSMKSAKEKKGQGDTNSIRHDPLCNPNQLKGSEIFYPPTSPFYLQSFFWRQNIFRYKIFKSLKYLLNTFNFWKDEGVYLNIWNNNSTWTKPTMYLYIIYYISIIMYNLGSPRGSDGVGS